MTRAIRMLDHNQAQVLKTEKYWDDHYVGIQGKTSTLSKTDRIVGVEGDNSHEYNGRKGYWRNLAFLVMDEQGNQKVV